MTLAHSQAKWPLIPKAYLKTAYSAGVATAAFRALRSASQSSKP